uniref:Uncharacterized protein n=1 Tax=Nelumbo nucifera TaxID=4432 RepID=A0A822YZH8_NELNU|nr:TPA_asm: hypothetical protein HUJ06_007502 [Nelumbo nucifera]
MIRGNEMQPNPRWLKLGNCQSFMKYSMHLEVPELLELSSETGKNAELELKRVDVESEWEVLWET